MLPALIATGVLAALALGLSAYLHARRAALAAQRDALRADRDRLAAERDQLADRAARLDQENRDLLTRLERSLASHEQAQRQFDLAQRQARDAFAALAADALKHSGSQFLQLAEQHLAARQQQAQADLDQRRQAIAELLKPVRDSLDKHEKAVHELETRRESAYQSLRTQVAGLVQTHDALAKQTTTLGQALRGSATARGRWGELTLRRIVELAGMVEHCDFESQPTFFKGDEAQRPDLVVRLPSDRVIVVDAKAVGANYFAALEAADPAARERSYDAHLRDIKSRIDNLARKSYTEHFQRAPDFVVLFLPGESFLAPAVERDPQLLESALARGVLLATPTILISLLKAVALGWREERLAQNALAVQRAGAELHERIAKSAEYIDRLGGSLGKAVEAYNQFLGSYESRVLVSARKLAELHAGSDKPLPEPQPIDAAPRPPRS